MNCNDFEAIAGDLSKDGLMEAGIREKGLEHSASCPDCAARLEDERALTGGLRFLAGTSAVEAPSSVEAAVLAAFRQHRTESSVPQQSRFSNRRWIYVAASVAATVLIVGLLVLNASRSQTQHTTSQTTTAATSTEGATNAAPAAPKESPVEPKAEPRNNRSNRVQHRGITRQKPSQEQLDSSLTTEIATDFIPLTNREALAQMDGGQVMRVELPRSALMSFGLPMDMERATERIKADVLVGNDGLARAI